MLFLGALVLDSPTLLKRLALLTICADYPVLARVSTMTVAVVFVSLVLLVSIAVMVYVDVYMSYDIRVVPYTYVTGLFILSILILVSSNRLLVTILGWDGLGITSYFLVAHYQSPSAKRSSRITVLTNRLGDAFIVMFMIVWLSTIRTIVQSTIALGSMPMLLRLVLLFVAGMTKRAIFPFSA